MSRELQHGTIAKGFNGFFAVPEADRDRLVAEFDGVVVEDFDGNKYLIPTDALEELRLDDDEVNALRDIASGDAEVSGFDYRLPAQPNAFGMSFAKWGEDRMKKQQC